MQLGHALYLVGKKFSQNDDSPYLIVFGEKDEKKLQKALDFCRQAGIMVVEFREPDLGNELTAFATAPLIRNAETQRIFRKYQLLKE